MKIASLTIILRYICGIFYQNNILLLQQTHGFKLTDHPGDGRSPRFLYDITTMGINCRGFSQILKYLLLQVSPDK